MRMYLTTVCALLCCVAPMWPLERQQFVIVEGILSRDRDAYWEVHLSADHKIQVNGKPIDVLRFIAYGTTDVTWCAKYEGKELFGRLLGPCGPAAEA
jgi:hypothetical protein